MNANVATMTANSCRQASIPAMPRIASRLDRLRTPWIAHKTNGSGELKLTKIVPDERPEHRSQRNEGRRRDRQPSRTGLGSHQRISRGNDPPEHDVLDHQQRSWIGKQPINRRERKANRGEVVHLPDRRPLLGVPRKRTDRDLAIAIRERPEPLVVVGQVPGPAAAKLLVANERLDRLNPRSGRPSAWRQLARLTDTARPSVIASWSSRAWNRIHRIPRRLAEQDPPDFLRGLGTQLGVALDAVKRGVGREQDVGMGSQPVVVERLALDHVESRAVEMAAVEGVEKGGLVDHRPARRVDQDRSGRIRAIVCALIKCRVEASR